MCITTAPAELEKTILLANSVEIDGRTHSVIGYQNVARNRAPRPNAMILPFPAADPMTRENCIDVSTHKSLLKRYAELVRPSRPRTRGLSKGLANDVRLVEVFDSGSYTVVLAADAKAIPAVLEQVPAEKRPTPHPELFDAYDAWYPGWTVAVCCWDGAIEAEPLLWWYRPTPEYRDRHFLPGLDGHDGNVPDPARKAVPVDHAVVVGSYQTGSIGPNATSIVEHLPDDVKRWLPDHVYGTVLRRQMKNGDWVVPKDGWTRRNAADRLGAPRTTPPGFSVPS